MCVVARCERSSYARGMCQKHYNRLRKYAERTSPRITTRLANRYAQQHRRARCSECGGVRGSSNSARESGRCDGCRLDRRCVECGGEYRAVVGSQIFCSDACRPESYHKWWRERNPTKARHNATTQRDLRRARMAGVESEWFRRKTIYQRDDWVCGVCHEAVDPDLKYPDPLSASLDHIIPISEGGPHTRANVRLTHWICNVRRGDRGKTEQLKLLSV